jgi:bifunctional DNA-binding transcriptional regulator/antitoxin component of YhaV-PrlF toxin-antitoxin module
VTDKPGQQGTRYEVITQADENGDVIIPLPLPLLKKLGWKEGDDIDIQIDKNGKFFLKKAD